ncbi:MAG: hypothetical protein IPG46_18390 [Actinobacteria bacterium]|nr:hypothetical protein [Actinomycetota bacterium]
MSPDVLVVVTDVLSADGRRQVQYLVEHLAEHGHDPGSCSSAHPRTGRLGPGLDRRPSRANSRSGGSTTRLDSSGPSAQDPGGRRGASSPTFAAPAGFLDRLRPGSAAAPGRSPLRPPRLIVHLADPGATPRWSAASANAPDLWMAITRRQVELVDDLDAIDVIGGLGSTRCRSWADPAVAGPGPIVLSTPAHRWLAIDHLVEIVDRLLRHHPDLPLLVLADPGEDEWLVRHDLAHLGAEAKARVAVITREDRPPERPRMIVRTGYVASDPDLVAEAARAGIPTVGFELGDLPESNPKPVPPFEVELLVDQVTSPLDPGPVAAVGSAEAGGLHRIVSGHDPLTRLLALL